MKNEDSFPSKKPTDIRLENELLKLKMQAEFGAHFCSPDNLELPPELEHEFLNHIMEFHAGASSRKNITVAEYLGNPVFPESKCLDKIGIQKHLKALQKLLMQHHIQVAFLAKYPEEIKYEFLSREFMDAELEVPFMDGMNVCFIYEEFHPNHEFDILQRTQEFMHAFFRTSGLPIRPSLFNDFVMSPEGREFDFAGLERLIERFHDVFERIEAPTFHVTNTSWQKDEELQENVPRMGFSEGMVKYQVHLTKGETVEVVGPFKLYLQQKHGYWQIFSFHLHGFEWPEGTS